MGSALRLRKPHHPPPSLPPMQIVGDPPKTQLTMLLRAAHTHATLYSVAHSPNDSARIDRAISSHAVDDLTTDTVFEVVSWKPRIFVAHHFLTEEECDAIVALGGDSVERSKVVGANGQEVVDNWRTSYGTFLTKHVHSDVYKSIESKIEKWTHIPANHGEVMYLLRYQLGQEYRPHFDYFDPAQTEHLTRGGNRIATVVMYLSDVEEGGETFFPNAEGGEKSVSPKKGDAVLFFDYTPDGEPDPLTLHGGRPVIKGLKWSLTRWIRARPFWTGRL